MDKVEAVNLPVKWRQGPERDKINKLIANIHGYIAGINASLVDASQGPPDHEHYNALADGAFLLTELCRDIDNPTRGVAEEDMTEKVVNSVCNAYLNSIDREDFRKQLEQIIDHETVKITKKPKNSPSKGNEPVLQLRMYKFDEKAIEKLVKDNDVTVNDAGDLRDGRKAKTNLNREMLKIKKVHTDNKRSINQFKKDVIDHDSKEMNKYLNMILPTWQKIDSEITTVTDAIAAAEQNRVNARNNILSNFNRMMNESSEEDKLKEVINKLNDGIDVYKDPNEDTWPAEFQSAGWEERQNIIDGIQDLKTMTALKIKKIQAGIDFKSVDSEGQTVNMDVETRVGMNDTQLLGALESIGGNKGWTCSIGMNGVSLYQDPNSNKSLRVAIEEGIKEHQANAI